jgi:hypothetical protein
MSKSHPRHHHSHGSDPSPPPISHPDGKSSTSPIPAFSPRFNPPARRHPGYHPRLRKRRLAGLIWKPLAEAWTEDPVQIDTRSRRNLSHQYCRSPPCPSATPGHAFRFGFRLGHYPPTELCVCDDASQYFMGSDFPPIRFTRPRYSIRLPLVHSPRQDPHGTPHRPHPTPKSFRPETFLQEIDQGRLKS